MVKLAEKEVGEEMVEVARRIEIGTPEEEDSVIQLMMRAVAQYIKENGLDVTSLCETKLQKILCETSSKLDLPITRSWYMRGEYIPNPIIKRSNLYRYLQSSESHLTDNQRDIYNVLYKPVSNIARDFWPIDIGELLERLYSQKAPTKYRRLYISNNNILAMNKRITHCFRNSGEIVSDNYYTVASRNSLDIHAAMVTSPEFECLVEKYINVTDLFSGIYLQLDILYRSGRTIPNEVKDFFIRLDDRYYNSIWRYPALIISKNTMCGLQRDDKIDWCERQLTIANANTDSTIEAIEAEADDLNLIPTIDDLEAIEIELYGTEEGTRHPLNELWDVYNRA